VAHTAARSQHKFIDPACCQGNLKAPYGDFLHSFSHRQGSPCNLAMRPENASWVCCLQMS